MTIPPPGGVDAARLEDLRTLCGGAVHLPGDPLFDEARLPWNLRVDDRPAAVAYPAFPDEVAAVVRAASALGLRVAPQGTGHGAPPLAGRLSDAILLRTSAMTGLSVDAERCTARVGAGVLWGDVVAQAGTAGLACRHMSSPSVGVVGSTLGGGLSWYGRRYGLQCSALTAVELVLADGTLVRATDDQEPDLLWAARGGGGGCGVVTSLEFDLVPVAAPYAGMLVWDWAEAGRVLRTWAAWALDAPDEITTVARLLQAPDDPSLPGGIRGRNVVVIDGAVIGDENAGIELLAPLRALRPAIDTFAIVPAASLATLHLEAEAPISSYADSVLLEELPEAAIDALVATAGPGSGSRLLFTEIRQLGGALSRPSPRGGAMDHIGGAFLVLGVGADDDTTAWHHHRADARRVLEALAPWEARGRYMSMVDDPVDMRRGWSPAAWDRLQRIRTTADPGGLFVGARDAAE